MPLCRECDDEVTELVRIKFGSKTLRLCEDCADRKREEMEIADMSEDAMRDMMGYKGSW